MTKARNVHTKAYTPPVMAPPRPRVTLSCARQQPLCSQHDGVVKGDGDGRLMFRFRLRWEHGCRPFFTRGRTPQVRLPTRGLTIRKVGEGLYVTCVKPCGAVLVVLWTKRHFCGLQRVLCTLKCPALAIVLCRNASSCCRRAYTRCRLHQEKRVKISVAGIAGKAAGTSRPVK